MKYLICQDYSNTANNHAGMKHMCYLLKKHYPNEYEVVVFADLYTNLSGNKFLKRIQSFLIKRFFVPYKYLKIGKDLKGILEKKDSVYLLEYCELLFPQLVLAQYLKKHTNGIKIYGLVHLVPQKLEDSFTIHQIQKWLNSLDVVLTFGSSLSNYFTNKLSISENKVKTLFHYADLDYYQLATISNTTQTNNFAPKVLAMGNQKRNFEVLLKIVKDNPHTQFIICQGVLDLNEKFAEFDNVELIGFIEESELLIIMQNSDISLNIMDDTIGSNVITTSMAVGLAMIVSDLGSIREYCKDDGALYCNNDDIHSFSLAIKELTESQAKLDELKEKSMEYSKAFSIHHFHNLLDCI